MTDSQAVATRDDAQQAVERRPQNVLSVFGSGSFREQVAAALPAHIGVESMMRIALTEVRKNPDLEKCTVPSFMGALLTAAQLGLRPGYNGEGWLIPRWNKNLGSLEAQFQPGYRGLAQLAYRSGEVVDITAEPVYAADHFRYTLGSSPHIEHVPDMEAEHRDADIRAFYAVIRLKSGGHIMKVLRRADADEVRDRFGPHNRQGQTVGPWATDYAAMGCKTAVLRALKFAPLESERLNAAIKAEEDALFGDRVASAAVEQRPSVAERVAERIGAALPTQPDEECEGEVVEDGRICAEDAVLRPDTPFEGQDSPEASEGLIRENRETAETATERSLSELAADVAAKAKARSEAATATRKQVAMLYTQQTANSVSDAERDAYLVETLGVSGFEQVPRARVSEVVAWLKGEVTA